jgi:hypothetical protein
MIVDPDGLWTGCARWSGANQSNTPRKSEGCWKYCRSDADRRGDLDARDLREAERGVLAIREALGRGQLGDALVAGENIAVLVERTGLGLEAGVDAHVVLAFF